MIASSVAWIMVASTVPSTTRRSASCTVPCTLMPRPTTRVRRSDGSRATGRIGGRAGRAPTGGTACGAGAVVNGCRDMICTSCGWAGRKGGTPRPLSVGLIGAPGKASVSSWSGIDRPAGKAVPGSVACGSSGLRRLNTGASFGWQISGVVTMQRGNTAGSDGTTGSARVIHNDLHSPRAPGRAHAPWRRSRPPE